MIKWSTVISHPEKFHQHLIFNRLHSNELADIVLQEMLFIFDSFQIFVFDLFEKRNKLIFHLLNRHGRKQYCSYSIGTVLVLVEINKVFLHCRMRQCIVVTYAMVVIGTAGEML